MWSQNALDPAYKKNQNKKNTRCKQDNFKSCGKNKNKFDANGFP